MSPFPDRFFWGGLGLQMGRRHRSRKNYSFGLNFKRRSRTKISGLVGRGSGDDFQIARSHASSSAGFPLFRASLTLSTSPVGSSVTSNSASGLPVRSVGSVMFERIFVLIWFVQALSAVGSPAIGVAVAGAFGAALASSRLS